MRRTSNKLLQPPAWRTQQAARKNAPVHAKGWWVAVVLPWDGSYVYQILTELRIVSCFVVVHDEFWLLGVTILAVADEKQKDATCVQGKSKAR
jgi:hypothetical protein